MKHSVKEIIFNNWAELDYICEGKIYYTIKVGDSIYQLEIDSNADEWKTIYIQPSYKAITLMRWIRKGMKNGKLIQTK